MEYLICILIGVVLVVLVILVKVSIFFCVSIEKSGLTLCFLVWNLFSFLFYVLLFCSSSAVFWRCLHDRMFLFFLFFYFFLCRTKNGILSRVEYHNFPRSFSNCCFFFFSFFFACCKWKSDFEMMYFHSVLLFVVRDCFLFFFFVFFSRMILGHQRVIIHLILDLWNIEITNNDE